jgi:hypothetical protein
MAYRIKVVVTGAIWIRIQPSVAWKVCWWSIYGYIQQQGWKFMKSSLRSRNTSSWEYCDYVPVTVITKNWINQESMTAIITLNSFVALRLSNTHSTTDSLKTEKLEWQNWNKNLIFFIGSLKTAPSLLMAQDSLEFHSWDCCCVALFAKKSHFFWAFLWSAFNSRASCKG